MDSKQKLGAELKAMRKAKKVTTYQLRQNGFHPRSISDIENGKNYTIDTLFKYLDIIGLELAPKEKTTT